MLAKGMPALLDPEYDHCLRVVNNWRSAHQFPLNTFHVTLKVYAKNVNAQSLTAQRSKRLQSIQAKLARYDWLSLSQMQDLGGCRAVMKSVKEVDTLVSLYRASRIKHKLIDEDDYIRGPKKTGYRGIHLIYEYASDKKTTYNGLKVEIQIRSLKMHGWATAVEVVDTFTKQGLKTGHGKIQWKRFFALMATYLAIQDKTEIVPKTPTGTQLIEELRHLASELQVIKTLQAYGILIRAHEDPYGPPNAHYYVLSLDATLDPPEIFMFAFQKGQIALAEEQERRLIAEKPTRDVVVVSVDSVDALPRAYPNYYLDTTMFLGAVAMAVK